ncbi:MAG: phospholipase D family protein [Candidatus Paracaedibacteraceae bacterium]|nr:phospholipase D family protein [Candidatus Paracaedibacteraceae bacterium]
MKNKKAKHKASKQKFSLRTVVAAIGIAFGAGYNISYYVVAHYELPTLIQEKPQDLMVCFTPNRLCQQSLLIALKMTKQSIYLQAYSFTDKDIADALIDAKKRGVDVQIILDKSNKTDKHSKANLLAKNGINVHIDSPPGIAHNKVIILDQETVVSGSYNFSAAAYSRNAENLLFIKNTELAQQYFKNWTRRKDLSQPYQAVVDAVLINKRVIATNSALRH